MKNYLITVTLLLLSFLQSVKALGQRTNSIDSLLFGKWTGQITDYFFTRDECWLEFSKIKKGKFVGKFGIVGRGHYDVIGEFSNNLLRLTQKNEDKKCPFIIELPLASSKNKISLDGWYTNCRRKYGVYLSRIPTAQEKQLMISQQFSNIKLTQLRLFDYNDNKLLENGELGTIVATITNASSTEIVNPIFRLITEEDEEIFFEPISLLNTLPPGSWDCLFVLSGKNIKQDRVKSFSISIETNDKKIVVGDFTITLSKNRIGNFKTSQKLDLSAITGTWINSKDYSVLDLKEDGTFSYLKDKIEITGKWMYYLQYSPWSTSSNKIITEKIIFNKIKPNDKSLFREGSTNPLIAHFSAMNQNPFVNSRRCMEFTHSVSTNGSLYSYTWYRIDNFDKNSQLIKALNSLIVGKWQSSDDFARLKFNEDGTLVHYDKFSQTDRGIWMWSYEVVGNDLKCYLWLMEGRVRGIDKWELDLQKSTKNSLAFRTINTEERKVGYLEKKPDLIVPEVIVGLTTEEILKYGIIGNILFYGFFETPENAAKEVFKNIFSPNIMENEFASIISLIRELSKK